jgi:hypothetical protein
VTKEKKMAKEKSEKTPIQKTADKARTDFAAAKEKHAKTQNDANAKAMTLAKTAMQAAVAAENRERFVRLGGARGGKVIDALETLVNVANPRAYSFTATDIPKIFGPIEAKLKAVKSSFEAATNTASGDAKESKGKTVIVIE